MARTDFSSVGHVRLPFCLSSFFVDQGHRVRSRPNYPYAGAIRCDVDGGTPSVGRSQSFSASPSRQACYAPTLSLIRAKPRAVFDSRSPPVGLSSGHSTDIAMGVWAMTRSGGGRGVSWYCGQSVACTPRFRILYVSDTSSVYVSDTCAAQAWKLGAKLGFRTVVWWEVL